MTAYFVPGRRAGRGDLQERIPELAPLRDAVVVVFGAGGLGAPSILEFARARVREIRIVDNDTVDPATVVRWPLGLRAAGHPKAQVLADVIRQNWPYTTVVTELRRIGAPRQDLDGPSDTEALSKLIEGASLLYDATAEVGVWHFASDLARSAGIPYVAVWTTPGAWGGIAARVRAAADTACWMCLRLALDEGAIPFPPGDPNGNIQPASCADPTFTGNGFDVAELALLGVRLAVATLCDGKEGSYPHAEWDVSIMRHRDETGALSPSLEAQVLERHPRCSASYNH